MDNQVVEEHIVYADDEEDEDGSGFLPKLTSAIPKAATPEIEWISIIDDC